MKPFLIAEVGCVHIGDMKRAKKLIRLAHESKADAVKFQKRNPDKSVPEEWKTRPHPNQSFAYGKTYLEHRKNLEFTIEQHAELKSYCEELGIIYSTSVWDMDSAREIIQLNPEFIKIPSACNQHFEMISLLLREYKGDVHISLGMLTKDEKDNLTSLFYSWQKRMIFYHCTSEYPCPFEHLYLLEIKQLADKGFEKIGFSNHGAGIASDIAAMALGARYFERHFIDDRTFPHTDASASLEPQGLNKLARDLDHVYSAMKLKPHELSDAEQSQRNKLKMNR